MARESCEQFEVTGEITEDIRRRGIPLTSAMPKGAWYGYATKHWAIGARCESNARGAKVIRLGSSRTNIRERPRLRRWSGVLTGAAPVLCDKGAMRTDTESAKALAGHFDGVSSVLDRKFVKKRPRLVKPRPFGWRKYDLTGRRGM
jgi:hypothetical protein